MEDTSGDSNADTVILNQPNDSNGYQSCEDTESNRGRSPICKDTGSNGRDGELEAHLAAQRPSKKRKIETTHGDELPAGGAGIRNLRPPPNYNVPITSEKRLKKGDNWADERDPLPPFDNLDYLPFRHGMKGDPPPKVFGVRIPIKCVWVAHETRLPRVKPGSDKEVPYHPVLGPFDFWILETHDPSQFYWSAVLVALSSTLRRPQDYHLQSQAHFEAKAFNLLSADMPSTWPASIKLRPAIQVLLRENWMGHVTGYASNTTSRTSSFWPHEAFVAQPSFAGRAMWFEVETGYIDGEKVKWRELMTQLSNCLKCPAAKLLEKLPPKEVTIWGEKRLHSGWMSRTPPLNQEKRIPVSTSGNLVPWESRCPPDQRKGKGNDTEVVDISRFPFAPPPQFILGDGEVPMRCGETSSESAREMQILAALSNINQKIYCLESAWRNAPVNDWSRLERQLKHMEARIDAMRAPIYSINSYLEALHSRIDKGAPAHHAEAPHNVAHVFEAKLDAGIPVIRAEVKTVFDQHAKPGAGTLEKGEKMPNLLDMT